MSSKNSMSPEGKKLLKAVVLAQVERENAKLREQAIKNLQQNQKMVFRAPTITFTPTPSPSPSPPKKKKKKKKKKSKKTAKGRKPKKMKKSRSKRTKKRRRTRRK